MQKPAVDWCPASLQPITTVEKPPPVGQFK